MATFLPFPINASSIKDSSMFNLLTAIGAAVVSAAIIIPLATAISAIGLSGVGAMLGAVVVVSMVG